ncbi:MAG TPA: chromate transporter [Stellaceae bacterium]|nr:chromate transporter [Stellaceae bacterium]
MENTKPAVADVSLSALFLAFFRLGCTSFGGGTGAWVYREMVQRRGWIDERLFLTDMALGQSLPGSNGIKMAILVGRRLKGGAGAFMAALAMLGPPFAIIIVIAAIYGRIANITGVHAVLDGVAAAVVGLTFSSGISAIARGTPEPSAVVIAGVTVLCVGVFGWPMLPVMLGLAPVSIAIAFARMRRQA